MNLETLIQDETLRAHVITIGRDFDTYGGDIPMATALTYCVESEKPKGYRNMAAMYFSKIVSAKDVAKRLLPVSIAAEALREEFGEDWLADALTAYFSDGRDEEAALECAKAAMSKAADALVTAKDDPWLAVKVLGLMIVDRLKGMSRPSELAT